MATTSSVLPVRRISAAGLVRLLGSWSGRGPSYAAVAEALRVALLNGSLAIGTRLPSERELATELGVSRTTTTAAYRMLREAGYLVSRQGSGSVTTVPSRRPGAPTPAVDEADPAVRILDLSMTAPSAPPQLHAAALAALERLPLYRDGHSYAFHGLPDLREAVADRYTARGVPTSPDQVVVTTGAQHALHLLFGVLAGAGDRVVVEHPTYSNAIGAVRERHARPVPVPMTPSGVDLDLLESTIRQTAPRAVYLVPDHHNPTGVSLDAEARERVTDLGRRHRTVVIADETLTDLRLDGPVLPPFVTSRAAAATTVCVGSASKSFWPGLRVGWVRGPRDLVSRLAASRVTSDIATPVLDQLVLVQLLQQEDAVLGRLRDELRGNRDHLLELLATHLPGWRANRPAGGMVVWIDLGTPASTALAAVAGRRGLRVAPGTTFAVDGSFDQYLRLTFSPPRDVLDEAVRILSAVWPAVEGSGAGQDRSPVV